MPLFYKTQTRFLFHAHIKIKLSVFYEDALFEELFGLLETIDRQFNSYQEGSSIDRINRAGGTFVEVGAETVQLLEEVKALSDFFEGDYDITVMPLIRLWGFYKNDERRVPSREEIERIKPLINYRKIETNGDKARIAPGQEIITGSFIKAYAIDRLIDRMQELGITDALVNGGGSTIYGINDEGHPFWEVNVREPGTERLLYCLPLANQCFSTSAQYQTFIEIEGKRYGHILNPRTGYPSENRQIGILSDRCFVGDVVSTGLFNLLGNRFLEKMEALSAHFPLEGFLVDRDGEIHCTDQFKKLKGI